MKAPPSKAPTQYQAPPTGVGLYANQAHDSKLIPWLLASVGVHVGTILALWLIITILQFLGFNIPLFNVAMKPRDVEFVLVDNSPAAKPKNPTKLRAERASRSGGQKIANRPTAMPQRAAGAPSPRSTASRPTPKPQPTPRPAQQQNRQAAQQARQAPARPQQQTTPTPRPTPAPAPKMPTNRTQVASAAPSLPLNPTIRMPQAPAPKNPSGAIGGPVATTAPGGSSGNRGGSGASGNPGPSMIAGSPTRGGSGNAGGGRPGGGGGAGGTGSYTQSGSPGGGGGRAGIDAEEQPDFGPYIAELQRRIRRNWAPPVEDRSKRVVALFKIARDGRLLSLRIQQSSGSVAADNAAKAAVNASAPFKTLPSAYKGSDIDVQFIFDYEIYGHGSAKMR